MMSKDVRAPEWYKMKELGAIPEEWEIVKVDHFCDVKTGGTPSTKHKDYWDGDIPWMSSGEINKKFVYNTEKKITQKGLENSNARILPADSVMIALNGQGKTRGSVAVLKIPSTCNQSLACIVPNEKISHYLYLFYNLQSRYSEIRNYTGDTGREGLNLKIIKDIKVPLPPFPEQQKIASILSKVDEQIEQTEQIIEKTELLKKGLMQKLLTKGIGHTKFKKTEFGMIPEEWKCTELVSVVDDKNSIVAGPFGSNLKVSDYKESGVPIIRLQNIERNRFIKKDIKYISNEKAEELNYHSFKKGDIVLAKLGSPIGKTCVVPDFMNYGIVVADVVRIRASERKASSKFLEYTLNSPFCAKQLDRGTIGTTRPRVNLSDIRNLKILVPPLSEQQKIASILSKVDSQIQDNQNYLTKLQELKKGLMQDLLTGKVRVCV